MTFEIKRRRIENLNVETTEFAEAALARRLAENLDAFLESADDETLTLIDETNAPRRKERRINRLFYKTLALATATASLAALGVASTFLTVGDALSPKKENAEENSTANILGRQRENDETSLIAWSVENIEESEWARRWGTQLANADVLGLYASDVERCEECEEVESSTAERRDVVNKDWDDEESVAAEHEAREWVSVIGLEGAVSFEPLKYEPLFQAVAASLQ
ncbi:MAG: hypothetical protein IJE97_16655 [Thermoguttaceae bacterium]|nr:hypothetical protein [Thermoguttaceae bacterium]